MMKRLPTAPDEKIIFRDLLGYLNFSSGSPEPRFKKAWNDLFFLLEQRGVEKDGVWKAAFAELSAALSRLAVESEAFLDSRQARTVLEIVEHRILGAYRVFHADLLFHQTDAFLFNPFFLERICRLVLAVGNWSESEEESEKQVAEVIQQANDYLGYRPIPILEGEEKHEPNPHEWVAALPIYSADVGAAWGPYHELVEQTLEILRSADPTLLHAAWFDPDKLRELAIDPRAFDFDHPVNRRPNYHFGTWDPHSLDEGGYYHRFIVHQVTLDGMMVRVKNGEPIPPEPLPALRNPTHGTITVTAAPAKKAAKKTVPHKSPKIPESELLFEGGAVLAGTILMGSGITGDHVQAHDSTVTLATLMPQIASYRDLFYEQLIRTLPEKVRHRLAAEALALHQPFGAARQSVNKWLSKRRAEQLQRFHLARLYARIGYFEAAERQAEIIAVAGARLLCRIDCHITQSYLLADSGHPVEASGYLPKIEDLLHRGIACGALADPWSLMGFGAQFSLFPAADNSVHDHRIDDLINLMNDIFDLYSRLMKDAAAAGNGDLQADLSDRMSDLAGWWDQFGSMEVSSVEGFSGQAVWESAAKVATALAVWHSAGTAAGDVAFWSRHVARFRSPKAFVLLGEALLDQNDPVASMALLMHWLESADEIPLIEGDYSFHSISFRWMEDLWNLDGGTKKTLPPDRRPSFSDEEYLRRWGLTKKFFERLEANAGEYGVVPELEVDPMSLVMSTEDGADGSDGADVEESESPIPPIFNIVLIQWRLFLQRYVETPPRRLGDCFGSEIMEPWEEHPIFEPLLAQEVSAQTIESILVQVKIGMLSAEENRPSEEESPLGLWFDLFGLVQADNRRDDVEHGKGTMPFQCDVSEMQELFQEFLEGDSSTEDFLEEFASESGDADEEAEGMGIDPTYRAAYDDMSFRDSAEDGIDDDMIESGGWELDDYELEDETDRINDRLAFVFSQAKLWKFAAGKSPLVARRLVPETIQAEAVEFLGESIRVASVYRERLTELLVATAAYRIPKPQGTPESLIEYDQRHGTKEILLDRIIRTAVEVEDALNFLVAVAGRAGDGDLSPLSESVARVMTAIFRNDVRAVRKYWSPMLKALETESLLYIPTSRGGNPLAIVRCRMVQQLVLRLLEYAPRLGLLTETFRLLAAVQKMERIRPNRPGAITEFDRIIETATRSLARCVIASSSGWRIPTAERVAHGEDRSLVIYMERTIDVLLGCWLSHSQHIRISSVESILPTPLHEQVKEFIQKYGSDIFTQNFLNFRNLRAILHQGVENYLTSLLKLHAENRELESAKRLIDELSRDVIPMHYAVGCLEVIFECVAENYSTYVDYNSTTTHSDHGDKLYMFLDMLCVLTQYERIAWNLKPVYWVHQEMIDAGREGAAAQWEESVGRRSLAVSEEYLKKYEELSAHYGVWLPSVHERLAERFVRPLQVDRLCGMIPEAVRDARRSTNGGASDGPVFRKLDEQIEFFARQQNGNGFEIPEWLSDLQDEVIEVTGREENKESSEDAFHPEPVIPSIALRRADLERQIVWCLEHISFSQPPPE